MFPLSSIHMTNGVIDVIEGRCISVGNGVGVVLGSICEALGDF